MKRLITITAILLLALSMKAQEIFYSVGYYGVTNGTNAALYKNSERLYIVHKPTQTAQARHVACDSEGNAYWWVNLYNIPENTLHHIEIWKNNEMYASTEGLSSIHLTDMYLLDDTLYYTGYQQSGNSVAVATVWKGPDFTPHYVLGDGIHASVIYDAEVDKDTNIPYFCGYVSDSLQKACVWEASQLLYKQEPWGYQRGSWAKEISIDNGEIYTNGYLNFYTGYETVSLAHIWKDNTQVQTVGADFYYCLYASQGDYYYESLTPHGWDHWICKNNGGFMQLPGQAKIQRICGGLDDIYMVGSLNGLGCIWKNFEVYLQYDNCNYISDIVVLNITSIGSEWYDETQNDNNFAVYPNPANDVLFVRTHAVRPYEEYRITNLMGQTLLKGTLSTENQQIDITTLPAGMYFICVGEQTAKFVVNK